MAIRLQLFGHRESAYERPTQPWVCGHSESGRSCRLGPDTRGRCRTDAECSPIRVGDRWLCTRPPAAGGPCEDGPLPDGRCGRPITPCTPVRSERGRRARLTRWVTLATLGCLFVLIGASNRERWLSPGDVSRAHGEVGECSGCHASFDRGAAAWLAAAFGFSEHEDGHARCLSCHRMGDQPMLPHGQPGAILAATTKRISGPAANNADSLDGVASAVFPTDPAARGRIACASCHREHSGFEADLRQVSDSLCQTCHSIHIASFADQHPEFSNYPSERRTHLIFDHSKHFNRHFAESRRSAPTTCGTCHASDLRGQVMEMRPFDISCAGCHGGQVDGTERAAGSRAIPVLSVPGLDVDTLRDRGFEVGEWPTWSEEDFTPFMVLILASDASLRRDLVRVRGLSDLLDLSEATDDELRSVATVAWSIKQLIFDLSTGGAEAMAERLQSSTGRLLGRHEMAAMVAALPLDAVQTAHQEWFPALLQEVSDYRSGSLSLEMQASGSTEILSAGTLGTSEQPAEPKSDGDQLLAEEENLLADDDDLLAGDDDLLVGDDDLLGGDDDLLGGDDDLLGGNDDLFSDDEIWGEDEIFDASTPASDSDPLVELESVDPEQWAALGGWYRRDYTLYYRPVGHADPFMRAWLDLLALGFGTPFEREGGPVFAALTGPTAPGACAKCHSIDTLPSGGLAMNWQPTRVAGGDTDFTTFNHVTHFSLSGGDTCERCHRLSSSSEVLASYSETNPAVFVSSFEAISKELCATCHTKKQAGDACVQCHRYHAGGTGADALSTEISEVVAARKIPTTGGEIPEDS